MPEPIEIKATDIIKRPLGGPGLPPGAESGGGFSIKTIKGYIDQIKEIKKIADDLGIDLGGMIPNIGGKLNLGGKKGAEALALPQARSGVQQVQSFLKMLQLKYGDITMNELLDNLKRDYGKLKISTFLGGGLP